MGEHMERQEERYYTTKELTDYFKISRYAIIRAVNTGNLKVAKKDGNKNLFSETDIMNYISTNN